MSGDFNRCMYDKWRMRATDYGSVSLGNRALWSGSRVNSSFNNATSVLCPSNVGCVKMAQPNSTIGTGPDDISKRIDLSNELRGTDRFMSRCTCSGWYPCTNNCNQKAEVKQSSPIVAFNPQLHSRHLFPTNMDVEWEQGFGKNSY
jgi:hypothetical protein